MSCSAFERWLDEGRPAEGRAAAEAHRDACEACARRLHAMDEIEDLLSARFAAAPAAFVDRVMEGLPPRPARRVAVPDPEPDFPWWVSIAQEPLVAGSLVAAGGLLAALPALSRIAASSLPHARAIIEHGSGGVGAFAAEMSGSWLVAGAAMLFAAAAPLLLRAAAAAGDPSRDGDL